MSSYLMDCERIQHLEKVNDELLEALGSIKEKYVYSLDMHSEDILRLVVGKDIMDCVNQIDYICIAAINRAKGIK